MKLSDYFTAEAIANNWTEVASNSIPLLGTGLFPAKKKTGLDLKWIKGNKGLPISLMPSTFDAKARFRDRIGVSFTETRMAFFREAMTVKEEDEQEFMRIQSANDPYANDILNRIFDDARQLVDGANVVPERMIMQLLAPKGGTVGINITANNTNYTYNYDPDNSWRDEHYLAIATDADKWNAPTTCDPMADIEAALDAQETATGNRPRIALMSKKTFDYIKNSDKVRSGILAQNATANVNYTTKKVKSYVEEELGITIVVYTKMYKNEEGIAANYYPDDIVMLLPEGALGNTYYGVTPEERSGSQSGAKVSLVNTGVAVTTYTTINPVNTVTVASEIVLPSFERLSECYAIEVA